MPTKEHHIRLEDQPISLLGESSPFSCEMIQKIIGDYLGTLKYAQREEFQRARSFLGSYFKDAADRSLPDDEKSLKQRLKEDRADEEGYLADEGSFFEEYDFLFAFSDENSLTARLAKEKEEELKRIANKGPVYLAFAHYMRAVSLLEMRLLMLRINQAELVIKLLKELCPDLKPETFVHIRSAMLYGSDPFKMVPELRQRMKGSEKEYDDLLRNLNTTTSSRFPQYAQEDFKMRLAPTLAAALTLSHKPCDEAFEKRVCAMLEPEFKNFKKAQFDIENQYKNSMAPGILGALPAQVKLSKNPWNDMKPIR